MENKVNHIKAINSINLFIHDEANRIQSKAESRKKRGCDYF